MKGRNRGKEGAKGSTGKCRGAATAGESLHVARAISNALSFFSVMDEKNIVPSSGKS